MSEWRRDKISQPVCLCDHRLAEHVDDPKRKRRPCEAQTRLVETDDVTAVIRCDCPDFSHAADLFTEHRTVLVWLNEAVS